MRVDGAARAVRTGFAADTIGFRLLQCVGDLAIGVFPRLLDRIGTFIEPFKLLLECNVAPRGGIDSDTMGRGRHGLILLDCHRAASFRSVSPGERAPSVSSGPPSSSMRSRRSRSRTS